MKERVKEIIANLPLTTGKGLEVAPLCRPIVKKTMGNVDYTDYQSTQELRERVKNLPEAGDLVDIDFVWAPQRKLKTCAENRLYDYVVSSHVLEHVPNPIGWLEQQIEVCRPGAIITMALPTKFNHIDFLRAPTTLSEWVGAYVESRTMPSAQQVFDCLNSARHFPLGQEFGFHKRESVLAMPRIYLPEEAVEFARRAYEQQVYTDVHCSVFTIDSFRELMEGTIAAGLLQVNIIDIHVLGQANPIELGAEFCVTLKKLDG